MKRFYTICLGILLVMFTTLPVLGAGTAKVDLSVTPSTNLKAGDTITVTVTAAPMTALSSLQFDLVYDPNKLELVAGSSNISGIDKNMMTIQNPDIPGAIRVAAISAEDITTTVDAKLLTAQFRVKAASGSVQFDLTEMEFTFALEVGTLTGTHSVTAAIGGGTAPAPSTPQTSPFNDEAKVQEAMENASDNGDQYLHIPEALQSEMANQPEPQPVFLPGVNLPTASTPNTTAPNTVTPNATTPNATTPNASTNPTAPANTNPSGAASAPANSNATTVPAADGQSGGSGMDASIAADANAPAPADLGTASDGGTTYFPDGTVNPDGAVQSGAAVQNVMQRGLFIVLGLLVAAAAIGGGAVVVMRKKKAK